MKRLVLSSVRYTTPATATATIGCHRTVILSPPAAINVIRFQSSTPQQQRQQQQQKSSSSSSTTTENLKQTARNVAENVRETAGDVASKVKQQVNKTMSDNRSVGEKVSDTAHAATDKLHHTAHRASEGTKATGEAVKHKANEATHEAKAQVAFDKAKDPNLPYTERISEGATGVKEKVQGMFSSGAKEAEKTRAKENLGINE
jgi:hypothetical protein